jgi:hypothetical protein
MMIHACFNAFMTSSKLCVRRQGDAFIVRECALLVAGHRLQSMDAEEKVAINEVVR